jgi:WD40 repeat protein
MSNCPALAELEAVATPALREHVGHCASCRIVVELIEERRHELDERARANECVKFEMLIAARGEGTIGPSAGQLLAEHLAECGACAAVAATMPPVATNGSASSLPAVSPSAYALGREVARGGMGRILAAEDLRVGRSVAVKELLGNAPSLAARFEREARVTARLQHPGVVPIYEIGRWPDGTPFYAMRMVEGRTLRETIADRATLDERLALLPAVIAAADAVAFAHGKRIIHRDLTPNNVLVGAHGDTVVIDWGLAKDLSEPAEEAAATPYRDVSTASSNLTSAGAIIGTAAYMPPEQARGASVDERADVYALGAILYHVLAGAAPYKASASDEVVRKVQAGPPRALAELAPGAPRDLTSIVDKAMARDPIARYPSARELADELRRFQTGRLVEAHHYSRGERARRWLRAHRAAVFATTAAAVALAVAGTIGVVGVLRERDRAETKQRESHEVNVTLLAEQGRQELLAGHPNRALPFLSAAYTEGDRSADTRFMIAAATSALDSRRFVLHGRPSPAKQIRIERERLLVIRDDAVEVWELVRGTRVAVLEARDAHLADATLSPDRSRLAAWSDSSSSIFLFDVTSGVSRAFAGHAERVLYAGFAGQWLVSVALDGTWRRWDLATGSSQAFAIGALRRGGGGPAGFGAPKLDRDGSRLLALRTDGTAEVWDVAQGKRLGQFHVDKGYGATLSSNGARAIVWNVDTVAAWDVASGRQLGTTRGPGYHIMASGFRPDGAEVFVSGDRGELDVWTSDLTKRVSTLPVAAGLHGLSWLGHGRMIVASIAAWHQLSLVDPDLEASIMSEDRLPQTFGVSEDGAYFAFAGDEGTVEVFDLGALPLRRRMFVGDAVGNSGSPDAARVATYDADGVVTLRDNDHDGRSVTDVPLRAPVSVSATRTVALGADDQLVVLDNSDGHVTHRWPVSEKPTDIQLSLDGRRLVVLGTGVRLIDLDTGRDLIELADKVLGAQLADDGHTLVALDDRRRLIVWDVEANRAVATIQLPGEVMWWRLLSLSSDGKRVAAPIRKGGGFVLHLYDATSGKQLATIDASFIGTFGGGNMIAGSMDGLLHVLRADDGIETHRFPIETGMSVPQATPDGTRFVVGNPDGSSEVRSLVDGRPLARFKIRSASPAIDFDKRTFEYGLTVGTVTDSFFVAGNEGSALAVWDIHLETRSPAEIARLVAERVPWRLQDGRLVPTR